MVMLRVTGGPKITLDIVLKVGPFSSPGSVAMSLGIL